VPEIVRDGEALVRNSQRVVIDMPQDVQLQTVGLGRNEIRPILQVVSPQTADRLRKFLGTTPAAALVDRAGGLEVVMLLMAEGQHGANATVGGAIFEYARSDGKPVDQLLSEADVQSAWRPQDLASLVAGLARTQSPTCSTCGIGSVRSAVTSSSSIASAKARKSCA
jgi:hypothetical protein